MDFGVRTQFSGIRADKEIAKITFSWIPESRQVLVDAETDSYETRGESVEDSFIILAGETIFRIQSYIERILDEITGN